METLRAEVRGRNRPKSERNRLRREGKVPGIVYGKRLTDTAVAVEAKTLHAILHRNPHGIYEMDVPGQGKFPVMIREVQRDALSQNVLHVDFHQIDLDEPVRTAVALEFTGEPPALREGGVLTVFLDEVEVRCLPRHLPSSITVDISGMRMGDSVSAGDLRLPPEVELVTDPDVALATILEPQRAAEKAEEPAADGAE